MDCGKENSSGRGGLGPSPLCLAHLAVPEPHFSLGPGRGPAASEGLPRLPWSFRWPPDPMAAPSYRSLHSHACHIMNPSGGFRHGSAEEGELGPLNYGSSSQYMSHGL